MHSNRIAHPSLSLSLRLLQLRVLLCQVGGGRGGLWCVSFIISYSVWFLNVIHEASRSASATQAWVLASSLLTLIYVSLEFCVTIVLSYCGVWSFHAALLPDRVVVYCATCLFTIARYVSAYTVTQLPFICLLYRLPLRCRLWLPLLLSCFFLVWSALRKFTLMFTSEFECPSFPYFLFSSRVAFRYMRLSFLFSPFDFVHCRFGASNDIVCGSFPCIGSIFLCITLHLF